MKKQKILKRLLGIMLIICLVCTGSFINFGLGIVKAEGTVEHTVPSGVARYEVTYNGEALTTLYNEKIPTWTNDMTIYLTYTVAEYTEGIGHQGYCGTGKMQSYPYGDSQGKALTNRLWNAGDESKSKILAVGYTYYVAFDVTSSGMDVRVDRVKDGMTETVTLGSTLWTNGGADVDYSAFKYFGLYLAEATKAKLTNVSIYDENGNDLGIVGNNISGAITKLREPVSQQVPSGVARYAVNYTGEQLTMLYNEKEPTRTGATTIYLTYTVDSYTAGIHHQGYCGTNTVDTYPYNDNTGVAKTNRLWSEGAESKILGVGYTYFVAFDLTEDAMTIRADRVKDGVTETVTLASTLCTPDGEAALDYATLKYFGLYLGESPVTAKLTNVSIYDASGNDLGVIGYNFSAGAITKLREPVSQQVPSNVARYNVTYAGDKLTMLYNEKEPTRTGATTIYLTYTVDSYTAGIHHQGYCGTSVVDSYPYDNNTGLAKTNRLWSEGAESKILGVGYTYFVAFDLTEDAMTIRADRVKNGVTEEVTLASTLCTPDGEAALDYATLKYFGLYLGESDATAKLTNVSIYDANGNDLGVTESNITNGNIEKLRNPVSQNIPDGVKNYEVSYTGQTCTMLCNQKEIEWDAGKTIYLTYTVDKYNGTDGNQAFCATNSYTASYPYGNNKGTLNLNKAGEKGNLLLVEGYTYYVAFEIKDDGMEVKVDRVKAGATEMINSLSTNTFTMTDWTSLTHFGLYLEAATQAELSEVSIYDSNGNDLGVQNSRNIAISVADVVFEEGVLTVEGNGSVSQSMINAAVTGKKIDKTSVEEIRIEGNISSIKSNAFDGFTSLQNVYIKDSVQTVSDSAFVNCASGVTVSCAPNVYFVGGLKNASVVKQMNVKSVGAQTSFKDGTLSLHLAPSATISGILDQTTYTGLSVKIDDGAAQAVTVKKTSYGTFAFELTDLDKTSFTLTIPAGIAKSPEAFNGVSGFELLEDTTVYVNEYAVTMQPMAGVDVTATVVADGANGLYFTTSSNEDTLAVGGASESANIYSYKGNDNGIFVNGEKTEAYLRKVEAGRYSVCLSEAGYSVANGDAVTISGCFRYGEILIAFAPVTVQYAEGTWSEMTSGTISMTEAIVDAGSEANGTYIVEGNSVEVLYPNATQTTKVSDNTVLYAVGDYTVSRTIGKVIFQKEVVIYRIGDVNADGALNVKDLVALKKAEYKTSAAQYAAQNLVAEGTDKVVVLRTKLVQPMVTKSGETLPSIMGATGADIYAADYISSIDATENGTTVFSVTDGTDTTYKTETDYDNYGLGYIFDFNFDREIKVLQLTDTQIIDSTQQRYEDRLSASSKANYVPTNMENLLFTCMRDTVKAAQPDLILLTGDIIYGEFDDKGTSLQALIKELDSYQIPWAPIFGNHDNESVLGVKWQCDELMKSEYCLFNRRHSIGGNGNYSIGLSKNGALQRVIYMMDSNFCTRATAEEYQNGNVYSGLGFKDSQITWYRDSQLRVNQVAGNTIPSFLCCHVPDRGVLEGALWAGYQTGEDSEGITYTIGTDVVAQPGDSGYKGAAFGDCVDTAMLPYMNEVGTDGAFFGHQHLISTSIYYSGVRYTFGLKTGAYDSHPEKLGGTLISLKDNAQTGESFVIDQIVAN